MTIADWLKTSSAKIREYSDSPRLDCLIMLENVLNIGRAKILATDDSLLSKLQINNLEKLLDKRKSGLPMAYIIGSKQFYGLDFEVNSSVLIPRPETEALVEWIVENASKNATFVDVGTGSGDIAVAVAKNRPDLTVSAIDISGDALKIAKKNAKNNVVKINFIQNDLFDDLNQSFDYLAANLPYVPDSAPISLSTKYEPKVALFAGSDGLDIYKKFLSQLGATGFKNCVIEHDTDQYNTLVTEAKRYGFKLSKLSDYCSLITR